LILLLLVIGKKKNKVIKTGLTYYKKGSSFEYKAASLYSATIHLDKDLCSFGFADTKTGDVIGVETHALTGETGEEKATSVLSKPEVLGKLETASKVTLYSTTSNFTIIPSLFFDSLKVESLIIGVIPKNEQSKTYSTFIPEIDSHLVFKIESALVALMNIKVGHINLSHHFASLITTYKLYYAVKDKNTVFVQYHQDQFTLCLFNGLKMIHFNVFDFKSYEDVVYYTYYTMEQFEFPPSESIMHLGGNYEDADKVLKTFQTYSSKIFQLKPNCCTDISIEKSDAIINTIFDLQCG
jgi:hypothetical protein